MHYWQYFNVLTFKLHVFVYMLPIYYLFPGKNNYMIVWMTEFIRNGFRAFLYGCLTMSKEPIIICVSMQKCEKQVYKIQMLKQSNLHFCICIAFFLLD